MAIKDQMSATEQMKKIDDIQESHMVGGWGGRGGGGGQPCTQGLGVPEFLQPPKSLVMKLRG